MELILTWATVGKVVVAAIGTYVLAPLFLVMRDHVLWICIDKLILTKGLQERIFQLEDAKWHLAHTYVFPSRYLSTDGKEDYFIGEDAVSQKRFQEYDRGKVECIHRFYHLSTEVQAKKTLISRLLRYYKQDGEPNPLDAIQETAARHADFANKKM